MNSSQVKFAVRIHQGGYDYQSLRRIVKAADNLGYYSVSLYDLLNHPTLECWTTLSALAAETNGIRLISLVLANIYRHPAVLAKMAATLDVISDGRLELGIGAGGDEHDHYATGLPYPTAAKRVAMLREAVQVIKLLWSGEIVSFGGAYYQLKDAKCDPAPIQNPRPPILIGGHGERHLLRAVAAHADMSNMGFEMSVEEYEAKNQIIGSYCKEVGRNLAEIATTHNTRVFIAETESELNALLSLQASQQGKTLEEFRKSLGNAIVGTPEQCAKQIQVYVNYGINYFFLLFPDTIKIEQLEIFAKEVIPRL